MCEQQRQFHVSLGGKHGQKIVKLEYETDVARFVALLTVAIGGGVLGLVLGVLTPFRLILAAVGVVSTLALSIFIWRLNRRIRVLIGQIKELP